MKYEKLYFNELMTIIYNLKYDLNETNENIINTLKYECDENIIKNFIQILEQKNKFIDYIAAC